MKILKAIATISIFTMLTRLLGFVLRIFLSRQLSAVDMGIYQIAFTVFALLLTLTASGVPLIISRETAKYIEKGQPEKIHSLVSSALLFGTIFSILICGAIYLLRNQLIRVFPDASSFNLLLMLLPAVIASAIYSGFHGALWGSKRYVLTSFNEFLEQSVRILICVLLFRFTPINKLIATGLSLSIACVISMLLGIILYFYYGGKLKKSQKQLIPLIKSSAPITGIRLSGSAINSFITFILPLRLIAGGMTNAEALSEIGCLFGMAFPLLFFPTTFIGALASVLVPELSGTSSTEEKRKKVESSISISILIAAIFVPAFIGIGKDLGVFVYKNLTAGTYISQCGIIMLPMAIEQIASSMMNSLNLEIKGFINYLAGTVILVVFVIFFTPALGMLSYIIGSFLQLTVSAILDVFAIKKKIGIKFTFIKPLIISTLLIIPCTALIMALNSLLSHIPVFLNLLICGIMGCGAMLLLCMCFHLFEMSGIILFKKKKKAKIVQKIN